MARRLIPAALLVPVIVGWVRLSGQRAGFYETEFGLALFATASSMVMLVIILACVLSLSGLEGEQEGTARELQTQRDALQRLAGLIDLSNDAIISADENRAITGWSGGAERLYGWKKSEAMGQVIHTLLETVLGSDRGYRQGIAPQIYLPAAPGPVDEQRAPVPPGPLGGSETILLVEDEDALRKYIHDSLKSRGYTVLLSSNGQEALKVAQEHRDRIDLLLSDVVMPEMGGIELADAFSSVCPSVPVLLMSGYSVRMWRKEVAANLIQKPFSPVELLTRIRGLLNGPGEAA